MINENKWNGIEWNIKSSVVFCCVIKRRNKNEEENKTKTL